MKPRILSLDGGGIRGLRSVQVLKYLSKQAGKPLTELFDLVAGTSTGSIQALALTCGGLSPADMEQLYLSNASKIFDTRWQSVDGFLGPSYGAGGLESVLKGALGTTLLAESKLPTLVMTYDLQARLPVALTSWGAHRDMPAWEAARASSAGPTFFPPFRQYVDGGTVCNNPALIAAIEAAKLFGCKVEDCTILSLGTGAGEDQINPGDAAGWGKLSWLSPLISIFTDGVSDLADYQLMELLPSEQYVRVQARVTGDLAAMDNVSPANLLALRQAGNQDVGARLDQLKALLERLTRGPQP